LAKATAGDGDLEKGTDRRPISKSDNIRVNRKSPEESGLFLELRRVLNVQIACKVKS